MNHLSNNGPYVNQIESRLAMKMATTHKSFISSTPSPCPVTTSNRISRKLKPTLSKKQDSTENSKSILSLRVPNAFLARSAVAVFGLGFIDAGYSGDWSRIGVISRETEEFLKVAAYVVIPLSLFLIFSFSKEKEEA